MKLCVLLPLCLWPACAADQDAVLRSWVVSGALINGSPAVLAIAPDVHAVRSDERFVYVESAGLSLHSFGALEANQYEAPAGPRRFSFRIPRVPKPADGPHASTPLGVVGVFATGVPIYNAIGTLSYGDQNLWHQDAVAAFQNGGSPLLTALTAAPERHSPIIGFALDGYPIYGPFGWDAAGRVHRMKSGYRLRSLTKRAILPDGSVLTPAQEGPPVGSEFPLGTFAEDYEYEEGADLDASNGRFGKTPEYPQGTYAYFLATTEEGKPAWPYLIGPRYFGAAGLSAPARVITQRKPGVEFSMDRPEIRAGQPVLLSFAFTDSGGNRVRFLEKVHEKPIHLIVVSKDLAEFDHIHPELVAGDVLSVTHTFRNSGEYTLYADYTAPGAAPTVARFDVTIVGNRLPDTAASAKPPGGVTVSFNPEMPLRAGEDLPIIFHLKDTVTGQPIDDLEPWLGAWGHILIVSQDRRDFIHAHPQENVDPTAQSWQHTHAPVTAGRSPSTIRTVTGFAKPGLYKLWFQFQRAGVVNTMPFVLKVEPAAHAPVTQPNQQMPPGAISVKVGKTGYEPSRIDLPANQPATLAFTRVNAQNCGSEVVFPEIGIRRKLPPGETVLIELPVMPSRELHFACGMGMYRGALVLR